MRPIVGSLITILILLGSGCGGRGDTEKDSGPGSDSRPDPEDCQSASYFQCGQSFTCSGGTVHGQWHEHVFDDPANWTGEKIVNYTCVTPCPSGECATGQPYPTDTQSGAAWVKHLCRPVTPADDAGPGPDATPSSDAAPGPDAMPSSDAAPAPDATPAGDAG